MVDIVYDNGPLYMDSTQLEEVETKLGCAGYIEVFNLQSSNSGKAGFRSQFVKMITGDSRRSKSACRVVPQQ